MDTKILRNCIGLISEAVTLETEAKDQLHQADNGDEYLQAALDNLRFAADNLSCIIDLLEQHLS